MDGTVFEAFFANFLTVFIVILFDFTNPKTTLLIVPPTLSMQHFPSWASSQCHSCCADLSKCVISANTYLERNCDERPSLHKMTFFNLSYSFLCHGNFVGTSECSYLRVVTNHCGRDFHQIVLFDFMVIYEQEVKMLKFY